MKSWTFYWWQSFFLNALLWIEFQKIIDRTRAQPIYYVKSIIGSRIWMDQFKTKKNSWKCSINFGISGIGQSKVKWTHKSRHEICQGALFFVVIRKPFWILLTRLYIAVPKCFVFSSATHSTSAYVLYITKWWHTFKFSPI